jgi:HEAT repeat protein
MMSFFPVLLCMASAAIVADDDVSSLVKQLRTGDVEARRSAANTLGESGAAAKDAVPALTEALKDNDRFVRRFAAQALGEIGPAAKSAVPALSALLRDGREKKEVLDAVANALGKLGADVGSVVALVATLRDTSRDSEVRRQAAESLGKMGTSAKNAIPALIDVLKPVKGTPPAGSGDLRVEVANAIGEIASPDDKPAVDSLTSLSNDRMVKRDRTLTKAIADALKKINAKKS